jgi:hypothetical protein
MTPMNESLLKTDKIGHLRYTPEQKKTMVDAYFVSGLSAPRFAINGVSESAGINRLGNENERVLQRTTSH